MAEWHAGSVDSCEGGEDHTVTAIHVIVRCACGAAYMSTDASIALGMASSPAYHPATRETGQPTPERCPTCDVLNRGTNSTTHPCSDPWHAGQPTPEYEP